MHQNGRWCAHVEFEAHGWIASEVSNKDRDMAVSTQNALDSTRNANLFPYSEISLADPVLSGLKSDRLLGGARCTRTAIRSRDSGLDGGGRSGPPGHARA